MNYWLFQSTISNVFGTYLLLSQCFTFPWPTLVTLPLTIFVHCLFGTTSVTIQIAATTLMHSLFSHLSLNGILTSVLILNAIPFFVYHIVYLLKLNPPGVVQPRLTGSRYIFIATKYLFSIKGLYLHWESKDWLGTYQTYIGMALLIISFNCLSVHLAIDHPRRLREAEIARDIRVVAGLGRRAWA